MHVPPQRSSARACPDGRTACPGASCRATGRCRARSWPDRRRPARSRRSSSPGSGSACPGVQAAGPGPGAPGTTAHSSRQLVSSAASGQAYWRTCPRSTAQRRLARTTSTGSYATLRQARRERPGSASPPRRSEPGGRRGDRRAVARTGGALARPESCASRYPTPIPSVAGRGCGAGGDSGWSAVAVQEGWRRAHGRRGCDPSRRRPGYLSDSSPCWSFCACWVWARSSPRWTTGNLDAR